MSFFARIIIGYSIVYALFVLLLLNGGNSLNPEISPAHAIWNLTMILWVVPVGLLILARWMLFGRKRRAPPVIDQN